MTTRKFQLALACWSSLHIALQAARLNGAQVGRLKAVQVNSGADADLPPPTLEEWMDTLALDHPQARADAANALGKLGKEAAVAIPQLTKLLGDDREVAGGTLVRDAAVKALGDMGSKAASFVPEMFKELERKSTRSFREGLAYALAHIGKEVPEAVLPALQERLDSSSWVSRWVAASTCGLLGEKAFALVPKVRQLAKYDDGDVRKVASQSLSDLNKVMTVQAPSMAEWQGYLDLSSAQARADAANALGKLGKEAAVAIPQLTKLLGDDREVAGGALVRDAAVKALGDMGSKAASFVPEMFKELERKSTRSFREGLAYALAHIGKEVPEAVLPALQERLDSSSWVSRWVAASTCGLLGEKAFALVPKVRQLAKYDDGDVRKVASQSLSDLNKVMTVQAPSMAEWQGYLDLSSAQARADAANALGKLGKEAAVAIPQLTKLLGDDREVAGGALVRDAAVKALGDMGSKAASFVPEMFKELERKSTRSFREGLAYALAHIGKEVPEAVLPALQERLDSSSWVSRWVAASTCGLLGEKAFALVPKVRQLAKYDDGDVRKVASQSLSDLNKVMTVQAPSMAEWQGYLDLSSAQARADAANALGKLGKEAAVAIPQLTKLLGDDREVAGGALVRDAAVKALGDMGSKAASFVPEMFKELERKSTRSFREGLAYALAHIGKEVPEAVLPALQERLDSSSWVSRWVAASTCGLLGEKAFALVPKVRQLAKYDDGDVRKVASQSLSDLNKVMTVQAPSMAEWQGYLDLSSAQARADAANALGKLGKEAAVAIPQLTKLLGDDREVAGGTLVRDAAVKALGDMGSKAASFVPEMFKELQRKSTRSFREGLAYALAHIGKEVPEAVLPALQERLDSSSWVSRWVAASTCGLLGEKAFALVPKVRQLAKYDDDGDVRKVASQSLSDLNKVMTVQAPSMAEWQGYLDLSSAQARADAANALGKLGKEAAAAIPQLTKLLGDDREVAGGTLVRDAAVKALGDMGSKAASFVPEMFKELQRKSTRSFRQGLAYALAHIGKEVPEAVLPALQESLDSSSWVSRWVAASTCGLLGEKAFALVPKVRQLAKYDDDGDVRKVASQSVSGLNKVMTVQAPSMAEWQGYLDLSSAQARADAANALGKLGKEAAAAIPQLTKLLGDDREVAGGTLVRDAAVKALGDMGSKAASFVPEMFKELQRKSTRSFRQGLAYALAHIGKEVPEAVLPALQERLDSSSWVSRWVAASTCGLLGEKAFALVPRVRQLAKYDDDEDVRKTAEKALQLMVDASNVADARPSA